MIIGLLFIIKLVPSNTGISHVKAFKIINTKILSMSIALIYTAHIPHQSNYVFLKYSNIVSACPDVCFHKIWHVFLLLSCIQIVSW